MVGQVRVKYPYPRRFQIISWKPLSIVPFILARVFIRSEIDTSRITRLRSWEVFKTNVEAQAKPEGSILAQLVLSLNTNQQGSCTSELFPRENTLEALVRQRKACGGDDGRIMSLISGVIVMAAGRIPLANSTNFSSQRGKNEAIKSHVHTAVGFIGSQT
ncbi:uncharacterized protein FFB14_13736 [Fusarium fujikuroi]|nr:uncharacterized protein FFB14_13736 [Fusarium fujikuroi]